MNNLKAEYLFLASFAIEELLQFFRNQTFIDVVAVEVEKKQQVFHVESFLQNCIFD